MAGGRITGLKKKMAFARQKISGRNKKVKVFTG